MSYLGKVKPTVALTSDDITDGAVVEAKIGGNAVTSAKINDGAIVNADLNTSAAIALSKLATDPSNASNLSSGTVPTPRLGSGTASSSTFLRGDNAWSTPAGGTLVNVVQTQDYSGAINVDGVTSYATAGSDFLVSITPTSTSSTILIMAGSAIGGIDGDTSYAGELKIYRQIASGGYASITASPVAHINGASGKRRPWTFMYLDSPSTTSQVDYQLYMRASNNAVVHFAVDGFSRFITALEIGA